VISQQSPRVRKMKKYEAVQATKYAAASAMTYLNILINMGNLR